ncbi:MAG: hypothetical protein IJE14_00945 [Clostridia bacterium]|nr:hypothetical protein [Clostridia bacterium]
MSNLGAYQTFTTIAKKFGGVKNLIGIIATGSATIGAAGGIGAYVGGKKIVNNIKKRKTLKDVTLKDDIIYKVIKKGESNEGLKFEIGNEFRVLEADGEAILIEIIGDTNNPYFVSADLLHLISNYK